MLYSSTRGSTSYSSSSSNTNNIYTSSSSSSNSLGSRNSIEIIVNDDVTVERIGRRSFKQMEECTFFSSNINEDSFKEISRNAKKKGKNVERYLVDESLSELEKTLHLLKNGSIVQKYCMLENLPSLFKKSSDKAISQVLKYFTENAWKESEEVQIMFGELLSNAFPFLSQKQMEQLLPCIQSMIEAMDEEVSSVWQDVLIKAVEFIQVDTLLNEALEFAISKGSLYESEKNRVFCCRLFGAFSTRFNSSIICKTFLQNAISMCQDTSFHVRTCMAEQIYYIANGVGFEQAKNGLLQELFQLSEDETKDVKNTAISTIISLLDFFDHKFRLREVLPMFLAWMMHPPEESKSVLITKFGEYFYKLSKDKHDEETVSIFSRFFREAASSPNQQYRIVCAYNLPAVLKGLGSKKYQNYLHATYLSLAHDSNVSVREKIAASLHEVTKLLAKEKSLEQVKSIFLSLARDPQTTVRNRVLHNMGDIFRHFKYSVDGKAIDSDFFNQVVPALVKHTYTIGRDWRTQEVFYSNFRFFDDFFSNEEIHSTFLPLLKTQILKGVHPVKLKAIESFVSITRGLKQYSTIVEIFRNMNYHLFRDKSFWNRLTYLELCHSVMKYFSRQFFKDHFFADVMTLSKDPVPNIRRKFCKLLPHIKQVLELPVDVHLLAELKEVVSYLSLDRDRDVVEAAQQAHEELTSIDNEIQRGYKLNLLARADMHDKQKQKEEEEWRAQEKDVGELSKNQATRKRAEVTKPVTIPNIAKLPRSSSRTKTTIQTRVIPVTPSPLDSRSNSNAPQRLMYQRGSAPGGLALDRKFGSSRTK